MGAGGAQGRLQGWLGAYRPLEGIPDELIGPDGRTPDHWLRFLTMGSLAW